MVKEAQKLARQEDKRKLKEALAQARAAGEEVESMVSSTLYSDKSGKKSQGQGKGTGD